MKENSSEKMEKMRAIKLHGRLFREGNSKDELISGIIVQAKEPIYS